LPSRIGSGVAHDRDRQRQKAFHLKTDPSLRLLIAALLILLLQAGFASAGMADEPTERLIGTLEGGWMAIGGEHTGWVLQPDGEPGDNIEVDVSCCLADAAALDGKRVAIIGTWRNKAYVERGAVRLLVAERIEAALES
jgi:hypothetical protein